MAPAVLVVIHVVTMVNAQHAVDAANDAAGHAANHAADRCTDRARHPSAFGRALLAAAHDALRLGAQRD